jgi:hypothetical protein
MIKPHLCFSPAIRLLNSHPVSSLLSSTLAFHRKKLTSFLLTRADVAELADALDSKSSSRK